ncbi:glycosyltransferase [Flexithrix dorotheae]|uniref:glycosyltransferase n=1 Tax=Flexithrix dorotheae TaxID=70993 RepID=UPI0012F9AE4B|nr:glycosyltransferase [Flexithrix dorotheae]
MQRLKILILVENLSINKTSSGIGRSKLIMCLKHGKHDISCLHDDESDLSYSWLEGISLDKIRNSKLNSFERFLLKIPKIRGAFTYLDGFGISFSKKIKDWYKSINNHLKENQYDLILVLGTGMSFAAHFAMAKVKTNIPWIANIHDPFPKKFYPLPYSSEKDKNLVNHLLANNFKRVLDKANMVSFPSQLLMEWMCGFYQGIEGKCIVIPHPGILLNPEELPRTKGDEDSRLVFDEEKINILHLGTLLGPRNPTHLFNAFNSFILSYPDAKDYFKLYFVGSVAPELKETIKKFENKEGIVIIEKRISYRKSIELMQSATVLLIIEAIAKQSPFLPGKFSDYVYSKTPFIALTPMHSEVRRLLGEGYEYMTETDDEEGLILIFKKVWKLYQAGEKITFDRLDLINYVSKENINSILIKEAIAKFKINKN